MIKRSSIRGGLRIYIFVSSSQNQTRRSYKSRWSSLGDRGTSRCIFRRRRWRIISQRWIYKMVTSRNNKRQLIQRINYKIVRKNHNNHPFRVALNSPIQVAPNLRNKRWSFLALPRNPPNFSRLENRPSSTTTLSNHNSPANPL